MTMDKQEWEFIANELECIALSAARSLGSKLDFEAEAENYITVIRAARQAVKYVSERACDEVYFFNPYDDELPISHQAAELTYYMSKLPLDGELTEEDEPDQQPTSEKEEQP